jgi:hypothetical protein
MKSNAEKALQLVKDGAPIAGAGVGGAAGVMTSYPWLATLGGAVGASFGKVVEDVAERMLSRRERTRVVPRLGMRSILSGNV